jgi:uncharacterized delta-60 repeat protein
MMSNIILSHNGKILSNVNQKIFSKNIPEIEPFIIGEGFSGVVYDIKIQADNKILVSGGFTSYSGVSYNGIIRLNTNGSIDNGFTIGTGFGGSLPSPYALEIQNDNKILVGGEFTSYSGITRNRIVRLNTDGSLDSGFTIGTGFSGSAYPVIENIKMQSGNKILAGGLFTTYSGITRNNIVRLNTDGSLDSGFTIGTGFDDVVYAFGLQSTGKIIVGGSFYTYNGYTYTGVVRLNIDGTCDTSFYSSDTYGVIDLLIQDDDKIIILSNYQIKRLNSDGSVDSSFNSGYSFTGLAWGLARQTDDKIIVTGLFSSYGINSCNNIVRINTDGSYDSTFNIGSGFDSQTTAITIQSDNKILIGGFFTTYNGNTSNGIIRLNSNGTIN